MEPESREFGRGLRMAKDTKIGGSVSGDAGDEASVSPVSGDRKKSKSKDKKMKRKEEIAKLKATQELVKTAYANRKIIEEFPAFLKYNRCGLDLRLESGIGESLSPALKLYMQQLLKVNMEGPFGNEWPTEEKNKRREMVSSEAHYILVKDSSTVKLTGQDFFEKSCGQTTQNVHQGLRASERLPVVAFVQYRFVVEHEVPVLYVYELQLDSSVQRKGLGKFLMQFLELIALKNQMRAVMLTVQKRNTGALTFYISKLRYTVSCLSPSRWDPLVGAEKNYDILCKTFDSEAKLILEEGKPNA